MRAMLQILFVYQNLIYQILFLSGLMVLQEILIHVHHSHKEIHTTRVVQESRNANEDHTTIKTPRLEELHIPNTFCISSSEVINFFFPQMHCPCVKYVVVL